jgi:hypothetical protein
MHEPIEEFKAVGVAGTAVAVSLLSTKRISDLLSLCGCKSAETDVHNLQTNSFQPHVASHSASMAMDEQQESTPLLRNTPGLSSSSPTCMSVYVQSI